MTKNQLSLIAQFDDYNRLIEMLILEDDYDNKMKILLQNCEKQRLLWLFQRNELIEIKEKYEKVINKNKCLETTLKNVREAFKKELSLREKLQSERDLLFNKLNQVQNYLLEDDHKDSGSSSSNLKETILSSLNLHKLTTVVEENSLSDPSLSDIEFDKTDEDLLDGDFNSIANNLKKLDSSVSISSNLKKNVFENVDILENDSILDDTLNENLIYDKKKPNAESRTSVASKLSALSQTLIKQRQSTLPNEIKVDNRPHTFVLKKFFKPEKCGFCSSSIGFCTSGYHCRECRAICHISCKDKVPLPCIPYVSRANIGKQGRLILISDFVPANCKPCVPALIVHCTTEIERRGLKDVGLYRVSCSVKEVKELKEKILKAKNGIPQLSKYETHVLCNVIKKFLCDLDEALINRITWRDFVEASSIDDLELKKDHFKDALINLPNANRDTIAFLMLHLRCIAEVNENKMTISNLARIFGPSIMGYSLRDPPSIQIIEENKKHVQVIECLLNLDNEFWNSILELNVFNNNEFNFSMINAGDISLLSPDQMEKKRLSIGGRLCGGRVNAGTMTPLKNKLSSRSKIIKPLF